MKREKCLKMPQNPTRQVHAVLGNLLAYQNAGFLDDANPTDQINFETNKFIKRLFRDCSYRQCNRSRDFQAMK